MWKKTFLKILLAALALVVGYILFVSSFHFSEGSRTGYLSKFAKKGYVFKTYEGEMILSSVSSTREIALASEKFFFTLTNKSLIRQFDTLQGDMVIVHYKQKNSSVFWRGDSSYLVDSVKIKR